MKTYDIFVIDPPWPQGKGGIRSARPLQGRSLDYETMSFDDIFLLLSSKILISATQNHSVFMWNTERSLSECDSRMNLLGYKRHCRFIWDKGNGVAPAFSIRYSHEYLVWYYKEKFTPIDKSVRGKFMTVFKETPRAHSRKPDIAYRIIDEMYPQSPRIDVFSREKRDGWDQFGDQIDHFQDGCDL